jgi:catechol 2,3-dioxygenase-like lactoylglutathione lyase family enzyme
VDVLSSRTLLAPSDFDEARRFYGDVLGLHPFREYGTGGRVTGVVYHAGNGLIEVTSHGGGTGPAGVTLWLQVRDVDAEHRRLTAAGVAVDEPPEDRPWGLREMWIHDPDGVPIVIVEVPESHPLRRRL